MSNTVAPATEEVSNIAPDQVAPHLIARLRHNTPTVLPFHVYNIGPRAEEVFHLLRQQLARHTVDRLSTDRLISLGYHGYIELSGDSIAVRQPIRTKDVRVFLNTFRRVTLWEFERDVSICHTITVAHLLRPKPKDLALIDEFLRGFLEKSDRSNIVGMQPDSSILREHDSVAAYLVAVRGNWKNGIRICYASDNNREMVEQIASSTGS